MPRISRSATHIPGLLIHVISRFVDGRFVLDDTGRAHYLRLLARALQPTDWSLVSYALMNSHIHLSFLMGTAELRSWALPLHVRFAQWINRQSRTTDPKVLGHVFADRPRTRVMCPSRARFLIAYHHRNPLEAGATDDVFTSTWTSHRAYMGLAQSEGGLDVPLGLQLAGFGSNGEGRHELHEFVARTKIAFADVDPMPSEPEPAPRRREASSASPSDFVQRAATVVGEPLRNVLRGSRGPGAVMVRRVALLAWLEQGFTAREMAAALDISPSAASRLLSRPHDAAAVRGQTDRVLSDLG